MLALLGVSVGNLASDFGYRVPSHHVLSAFWCSFPLLALQTASKVYAVPGGGGAMRAVAEPG